MAEMNDAHNNLQALFNTIPDFLFVLDASGRIRHVNRSVTDRLGYTEDELHGMNVLDVHPADRREEAAAIVEAMLAGESEHCPVPLRARDGTLIPVETRVSRGTWDGEPALFGVSKDVAEPKRSEEKFANFESRHRAAREVERLNAVDFDLCRTVEDIRALRRTVADLATAALQSLVEAYEYDELSRLLQTD